MTGIVLAALLWGTTGTAAALLPSTVGPLATGSTALCVGGLLLALTAPRRTALVLRGGRRARRWLVPGGLALAVYPLAFYTSMSLAGVAVGNVVSLGTAPLFAALLERIVVPAAERRALDRRWVLSAATAVAGVALLAAFGHPADAGHAPGAADPATEAGPQVLAGVALGLLAGATYATYTVTTGRLIASGSGSRGAMAAHFAVGGALLVPVVVVTLLGAVERTRDAAERVGSGPATGTGTLAASAPASPLTDLVGDLPPVLVLGYLALGPVVLAYLAFGRGLRTVPGSRATTVTLLEPFVATLLAVVAVGERLAPLGWLGLVLVLAGVVSVATEGRSRPGPPPRVPPGAAPA